jgi:cell division control protein 45
MWLPYPYKPVKTRLHKIQPIAGYGDLEKTGQNVIKPMMESEGGSGGVVVCLGVGGLVDLGGLLGIDAEGEGSYGGIEVWVIDARRPWNLGNVFGGVPSLPRIEQDGAMVDQPHPAVDGGKIERGYKPGKGGIIVFDDGDIEEELNAERDAYLALVEMPEVEDNGDDSEGSETESDDDERPAARLGQKRKSWSDRDEDESENDDDRPRQRRRSNSVRNFESIQGRVSQLTNPVESNSRFSIKTASTGPHLLKRTLSSNLWRFSLCISHPSATS